jgi:hypothetical protein
VQVADNLGATDDHRALKLNLVDFNSPKSDRSCIVSIPGFTADNSLCKSNNVKYAPYSTFKNIEFSQGQAIPQMKFPPNAPINPNDVEVCVRILGYQ